MTKEEDEPSPTVVEKEEDKAWHVIVIKMVDEAGPTAVTSEKNEARHVSIAVVAKEVEM